MAGFFTRGNDEPSPQPEPVRPAPSRPVATRSGGAEGDATRIAQGTTIHGPITGTTPLVVEGVVEGEIDLESQVVVGPNGRVVGKIHAGSVQVGGTVVGDVIGRDRVEVLATGRLEGSVESPRVVVAEGAFFTGTVKMGDSRSGSKSSGGASGKASAGKGTAGKGSAGKGSTGKDSDARGAGKGAGAPAHASR